ncbi:unnamed protein product [Effrenium voratum]|nr:unnamed protein product [Effrenium voratum]
MCRETGFRQRCRLARFGSQSVSQSDSNISATAFASMKAAETMAMAYKPEVGVEMPDKRMMKQGLADCGPSKHNGEAPRHPVERLLIDHTRREQHEEMMSKALVYGQHAPLRAKMERELLSQFQRLPGLPSSLVGLETVLDMDETIEFEDIMNLEANSAMSRFTGPNRGLHDIMEQRLNMRF